MAGIPAQQSQPAPEIDESRSLKIFFISAMLAVVLCISGGFLGMAIKDRQLLHEEMLGRVRRDFQNILTMRKWNAHYGGVFVEKKPGVISNPYLENPDITSLDGRAFTKKNPALMTRELSEMLDPSHNYSIHITSSTPLNPGNRPDAREMEALRAFEKGARERFWTERRGDHTDFRYMAPLWVEESCLACHAKQGYHVGDVRGGISISFRVSELEGKLRTNLYLVFSLAGLTILLLLGSVTLLFRHLVLRLGEARETLKTLATTDALTGLLNRRTVLQRLDEELARHKRSKDAICCALVDVDHFKLVNDRLGHLAGDQVLKQVAELLHSASRTYDVVGRYGGEEFILVLPGTDLETASTVVERIREVLASKLRTEDGQAVTASFGVAQWKPDESPSELLSRADEAMYQAKTKGRNRVEVKA